MNCERIDSILDKHAVGTLGAAERARVDAHLETCTRCTEAWAAHDALATEQLAPARAGLLAEMLVRVRGTDAAGPRAARTRLVPYGVAAAVAVLAIAVLLVLVQRPTGPDGAGARTDPSPAAGSMPPRTAVAEAPAPPADTARGAGAPSSSELAAVEAAPRPGESTPSAGASARFVEGTHYDAFPVAQPTSAAEGRIEVTFAFMYGCPGCYAFEPRLERWFASADPDVELVRLPALFNARARLHARAFYTAEALGRLDDMHAALFIEIHERGNRLASRAALAEVFARFGVDEATFDETFDSFAVAARLSRAEQLGRAYRLGQTPTVVVNGRYRTVPSMAGSYAATFDVVDELVAAERRASCPAAPPC